MSVPVPLALSLTPGLPQLRRPPETRPVVRNRTVLACCAGWSGPRCTEGKGLAEAWWHRGPLHAGQQGTTAVPRGRAASLCRRGRLAGALLRRVAVPGRAGCPQPLRREHGRVLPPALGAQLEERLLGALLRLRPPVPRRWVWGPRAAGGRARGSARHMLNGACPPGTGDVPLPAAPRGSVARHRRPAASCLAWAGSRYRSFDGRHFHFQGECAYSLAASADGTWAVTIAMGSPQVAATPGAARDGEMCTGWMERVAGVSPGLDGRGSIPALCHNICGCWVPAVPPLSPCSRPLSRRCCT